MTDANGNRTAVVRPSGARTGYAYDARNVLVDVTDALTHTTHYTYDENLNRTAVRDANGHTVGYGFDAMNRRTSMIYPGGAGEAFTFDAAGNLLTHRDANGVTITRTYDALNHERTRSYTGNSDGLQSVAVEYDANNNLTALTERLAGLPERITRNTYDEFDRATHHADPFGAEARYGYDANGNRTSLRTQDARITRYSFDALNRLSTVGGAGGSVGFEYDASGLVTSRAYGNGVAGETTYDAAGRPLTVSYAKGATILNRTEYAYNINGNRTLERVTRPGAAQRTDYRFDAIDRLTGSTLTQGATVTDTRWDYDAVGNRTDETVTRTGENPGTTRKHYTYDARDQLTRIDETDAAGVTQAIALGYDAQGNLTEKLRGTETTRYTYDANDQLISVARDGTLLGRYRNNALGLRVEKEATDPIHPGAPPVRRYTLWDEDAAIQERSEGGQVVARYEFAGREPVGLIHAEDGQQSLHPDALGSIVLTTDAGGAIHRETLFNAWGVPIVENGPPANHFGYTGHQMDAETGLIYAQARYYDPETGRFLTMDPAEGNPDRPASYHRYLYAYGNPTVYIDPDGQESVSTMIDNAAEGCGAWSCAGWALLKGVYHVGTFGFASVHDPVRDAYDEGKVSGTEYVAGGIGGGFAVVAVNAATGRMGGTLMAGATSMGTKVAVGAATGAVAGAANDAATQAAHIGAGIQEEYDTTRTLEAAATGAVIGGATPVVAQAAVRTEASVRQALTNRAAAKLETATSESVATTQAAAGREAPKAAVSAGRTITQESPATAGVVGAPATRATVAATISEERKAARYSSGNDVAPETRNVSGSHERSLADTRRPLAGPTESWQRYVQAENQVGELVNLRNETISRLQAHADVATHSVSNSQQVLMAQLSPKRQAQYLRGSMRDALEGKAIERVWRDAVERDPALAGLVTLGSKTRGPDFVFGGRLQGFGWGDLTTQRAWAAHVRRDAALGYRGPGKLIRTR